MFGLPQIPWGLLGVAGGTDTRPTNTAADTSSLTAALKAIRLHNATPNGRVARGFDQFGPQSAQAALPHVPALGGLGLFPGAPPMAQSPLQTAVATPAPLTPPALSTQAQDDDPPAPAAPPGPMSVGGAPLPNVGPTSVGGAPLSAPAPQASPDMGFFARNAAMMRDPSSGAFLDPANAERAQASGPDVINKLMSYFHQKDNPSDG